MQLSCCAYSYRSELQSGEMSLPEFLSTCRDLGCGAELTAYYFPTTERAYLNTIKLQAHRQGVSISGVAIGSDYAQPDADARSRQIALTREWVEHAVVLGAPTMRVFAGGVRQGQSEEQAFDNAIACLRKGAEFAAENGVLLALENHGGLTATAEGVLKLLRAVDHPALGLNLDFGNFQGDIYGQFEACAPYAVATHAKPVVYDWAPDAGATTPENRRPIPVDYRLVRAIMDAAGYRGYIAIEYEEDKPAAEAVPAFAADLRAALL